MLVEKGRSDVVRLAQGEVPSWDYVQHDFDDEPLMGEAEKLGVFEAWWRVRLPQFERNVDFNLTLLEALVERSRQRGFGVVIVELPRNEELIGSRWEAVDARYQPRARSIAAEHGVPYLDFNGGLGLHDRRLRRPRPPAPLGPRRVGDRAGTGARVALPEGRAARPERGGALTEPGRARVHGWGRGALTPRPQPLGSRTALSAGPDHSYLLLPILNILVPHSGHTPCVAGLPFFIVTAFSSFMVRLVRHLTQ